MVRATQDPILRTKLNPPRVRSDIVDRPRLVERLERDVRRPLTLVSAPAGYGKSTLAAQWLAKSSLPGVWLSLDESDNDPRSFLGYLVAAVRRHSPKACRGTREFLSAAEVPSPAILAATLTNELEKIRRPFILALDDYHRITNPDIHELLTLLLTHPPRSLHLVVLTRRDPPLPLVSMKAQGMAVELRAPDLRLSPEETRAVLELVGEVRLEESDLTRIMGDLEGWVTGLRLLCLALGSEEELADLPGDMVHIQEYLVEQVLDRQPPELTECLLRTSILDRFCAPLCAMVCADGPEPEGDGQRFLQDLTDANLFAISLDAKGQWFRYHHLFQQLLRARLERRRTAGEIADLHRRAGEWFAREGLVEEALEHFLAAGDVESAARTVEAARLPALNADEWTRLAKWLDRLPPGLEEERPYLLMGRAYILMQSIRMGEIPPILEKVAELIEGRHQDPVLEGEIAFFKGIVSFFTGEIEESSRYFGETLERSPVWHWACRAEAVYFSGIALHLLGDRGAALDYLNGAITHTSKQDGFTRIRLLFGVCFVHMLAGDWREALRAGVRFLAVAEQHNLVYGVAWAEYVLANAALQTLDHELAERHFDRAVRQRYVQNRRGAIDSLVGCALHQGIHGLREEAENTLRLADEFAHWAGSPDHLAIVASGRARVALVRGDLPAAVRWLSAGSPTAATPVRIFFLEHPEITECRVLVAMGTRHSLAQAHEKLERLQRESIELNHQCHLVPVMLLKALLFEKSDCRTEALDLLSQAVDLAGPGSFCLPFVEAGPPLATLLRLLPPHPIWGGFVARIQEFIDQEKLHRGEEHPTTTETGSLIEPLTNRELDVLELLSKRLYDKEIAAQLHISLHTVKSHLKNVYGKLHVGNRRQAVIRAEELGLL